MGARVQTPGPRFAQRVLTCPGALIAVGLETHFGFKIATVAQQDKIFQRSTSGNALERVDLDELLLVLKAQRKVPQTWRMTQMCDMLMAPFKAVFSDGLEELRDDMSQIKGVTIDWQKRMAPLENTPEARKERKALIKKEDAEAKVARKAAMRDAPKPSRSGKRTAPEPKVDTAKKQKMMSTVTPRVTRASASARTEAMVATHAAMDVAKDGIEGDATMFDAQMGPDWEAMYAARAHALVRERIRKMAFRVAQAVNHTDDDETDRSYAPVNDEDHGGRTAPEAVPQQADTAAPFDTDSFFV